MRASDAGSRAVAVSRSSPCPQRPAPVEGMSGWVNRATLLSDKFVEFGLAVGAVPAERNSRYGVYWCFLAGGPVENWIPS